MAQQTYHIGDTNKMVTAVEWLVKELNQELDYIPIKQWDRIRDLVEQAKQMEKEQMKDVYMEHVLRPFVFNFEEYYKETYEK